MEKEIRATLWEYLDTVEREIKADTEAMAHSFAFDFPAEEAGPSLKPIEYAEAEAECFQNGMEAVKHIRELKGCLYRMQYRNPGDDDLPF